MKLHYLYLIFFLFLLVCLPACEDEPAQPTKQPIVKTKKVKKKAVAAPNKDAEKKEKESYSYDPSGKKDPFFPILVEKPPEKEEDMTAADTGVPKTYLETLELSQLKLVAVMLLGNRSVAMVEDPEGKGHTIYIGTPMGKSGGKVVGIKESKILIEEKYKKKGEIVPVIKEMVIQSAEDKKR